MFTFILLGRVFNTPISESRHGIGSLLGAGTAMSGGRRYDGVDPYIILPYGPSSVKPEYRLRLPYVSYLEQCVFHTKSTLVRTFSNSYFPVNLRVPSLVMGFFCMRKTAVYCSCWRYRLVVITCYFNLAHDKAKFDCSIPVYLSVCCAGVTVCFRGKTLASSHILVRQ